MLLVRVLERTNQAQQVASTPYLTFNGELTAPVNSEQLAGIDNVNAAANQAALHQHGGGLCCHGRGSGRERRCWRHQPVHEPL